MEGKHFETFSKKKNWGGRGILFFWGQVGNFFFLGTGSQPGSALEVNPEVNPEAGDAGGMPLVFTQDDCLVICLFTHCCKALFMAYSDRILPGTGQLAYCILCGIFRTTRGKGMLPFKGKGTNRFPSHFCYSPLKERYFVIGSH